MPSTTHLPHSIPSEVRDSSPIEGSLHPQHEIGSSDQIKICASYVNTAVYLENTQNIIDPNTAFINNLIKQNAAVDAAFERLLKLHSEMQEKLAAAIGVADAMNLRCAIWDATCDWRDAWMGR